MSIESKEYIDLIKDITINEAGIEEKGIYSNGINISNAITGGNDHLYYRLKESFKKAKKIDIIVSFLMESGVRMILNDLEEALNRGVSIRILTGNYLNITQPHALYLLKDKLKDKVDLRFYNVKNKSFHPKSYMFHGDVDSELYRLFKFVASREEIIKQAAISFKNVRKSDDIGFFYGDNKDTNNNFIFSLVQTLGKEEYLNCKYFPRNYFDYIVIDEFHHAVSGNYKNIMEYVKPKFLLGLTATPERLDSKDVFVLCDYNNVYEVG